MKDQPEKFDLKSHAVAEDKLEELLRLFPEVRTEGGKLDFERLKLALGETVEVGKERYGMNWPGKADCFKTIQAASMGTLLPYPEESVHFDTTKNLIIEGDNLEVLKLLQKSYLGKIKMIYIDPPFNTGNDFIYPDDYTESLQTYLEYTGQMDAEGKKFGTNTETDGRFHSKWLNMMYPRLYLSKNLLTSDGLLFISIDDNEASNLYKLCNEIFGEVNFIGTISWIRRTKPINSGDAKYQLQQKIEYVSVYCRGRNRPNTYAFELPISEERKYTHEGKYGLYRTKDIEDSDIGGKSRRTMKFPILGVLPGPGKRWKIGIEERDRLIEMDRVRKINGKIIIEIYPQDEEPYKYRPFWSHFDNDDVGTAEDGKAELNGLLGEKIGFDTVKPVSLVKEILKFLPKDIKILDFFAGTGTTAHSIFEQNEEDGGNRTFILVQLPEPTRSQKSDGTWDESSAWKAGYSTIAEICKERVRRVIKKLAEEREGKLELDNKIKQGTGFRIFKLAESNFKPWDAQGAQDEKALEKQLELHIDHILEARTADDILYELLLKSGFTLTTPVEKITLAGKLVYSVANGALFVCLEKNLTLELIRAMAEKKPERVVCLDAGFAGNDQLKTNAVQIFKTKGVNKFQTV